MRKSTITDLPKDIQKAVPHFKENQIIMEIIRLAQAGEFNCFKSTKAAPKIVLVELLKRSNEKQLHPIINAVFDGQYDEAPDKEDLIEIKKDWISNGGSEEMYKHLFE